MTSKEKLLQLRRDFYSNDPVDYDSISYFTSIEKDLEMLELLKNGLKVDVFGRIFYAPNLEQNGNTYIDTTTEKIKEWLKDE